MVTTTHAAGTHHREYAPQPSASEAVRSEGLRAAWGHWGWPHATRGPSRKARIHHAGRGWPLSTRARKRGWELQIHGERFHLYPEATWGINNIDVTARIVAAFQALPRHTVALLNRWHREHVGHGITFHSIDPDRTRTQIPYLRERLREMGPDPVHTIAFGIGPLKIITLRQATDASTLELLVHEAIDYDPNVVASYEHGRIRIDRYPQARSIPHELGHAAEAMLGKDFPAEFAAYFAQYLKPAGIASTRHARTQLYQRGWLPSEYAGTSAQEFWAECFAYAFVPQTFPTPAPTDHRSQRTIPRHYLPVVEAIRRAFTKGRSPEEIRQILREALVGMSM